MRGLCKHKDHPLAVPGLVSALLTRRKKTGNRADDALRSLTSPGAVDALCALWTKDRNPALGRIVKESAYLARAPLEVRVLTLLHTGNAEALAKEAKADAVPLLLKFLADADANIQGSAEQAFRKLETPEAVNALCAAWAKDRNPALGRIVKECAYLARSPLEVRVLTALLTGRQAELDGMESLPVLLSTLTDPDKSLQAAATQKLRSLKQREAVDALCETVLQNPDGAATKICMEQGYRPHDEERAALFLFVTRQLDAYFHEDVDFEILRREYERAMPLIRARAMEIVRSGDRRCLGFFGARKPFADCSPEEITAELESRRRHGNWASLWQAFLELPLCYGADLLPILAEAKFEPEDERGQLLYRQIRELGAKPSTEDKGAAQPGSPLFERWLQAGREPGLARLGEAELRQKLSNADPQEGVGLVAALAAKPNLQQASLDAVLKHPHWLVRLAGHSAGLARVIGKVEDTVHWVWELAGVNVLNFWPNQATEDDLRALDKLPAEAWAGAPGQTRGLFRLLLAYHLVGGEWEERVIEAGAEDGEFEFST